MVYKLNRNPGGTDVLHRNPGEQCNTDDAEALIEVGQDVGDKLIADGTVDLCQHCLPADSLDG